MRVRIKGTNIYVKCIDVEVSQVGYKGILCEYLTGKRKGSRTVIPGDCLVEEYEEEKKPQTTDNNERKNFLIYDGRKHDFLKSITDKNVNATFSWIKEHMLLVEVKDYISMHDLFEGKALWAIIYSTIYWKDYVENNNNKQYVFIDFTKGHTNPESMIAFTYSPKYKVITDACNRQNESLARIDSSADLELRKFMYEKNIEIKDYIG